MKKYLFYFSYIGTRFSGIQLNSKLGEKDRSIAKSLALSLQLLKPSNDPVIYSSSRTDAGVHAINSTFHTSLQLPNNRQIYSESKERYRFLRDCDEETYLTETLNTIFKHSSIDISINKSQIVPENFHCRHSAVQRTYLYRFAFKPIGESVYKYANEHFPISEINRSYFVEKDLDISAIKSACELLVGTHDFRHFCKVVKNCEVKNTIKKLDEVLLVPSRPHMNPFYDTGNDYENLQFWDLIISARSFLYNQIRRIVGYLIAIGEGRTSIESLEKRLSCPDKWDSSITTAPPHGLYLLNVKYPPEAFFPKL